MHVSWCFFFFFFFFFFWLSCDRSGASWLGLVLLVLGGRGIGGWNRVERALEGRGGGEGGELLVKMTGGLLVLSLLHYWW
jgi:hypothetical protein